MAKKDSKKDIKDRVKKIVPQNEWLINVGKSLGLASIEVVKELVPNTASTVSWNKDTIVSTADMIKDIRNNNGIRRMFSKQLENTAYIKIAKDLRSNVMSDLKSGKLYNKNRELGLDDNGEFNFDDFSFDTGGVEFIDDDGSSDDEGTTSEEDSSGDGGGRPPVTVINTMPLAKTIAASTDANISVMNAIAEQNSAIENEKILLSKQTFNATMNALSSINDNLALLVQFNSDSTAKYQAVALKYFEESLEAMKAPEEEKKVEKVKNMLNPFTAEGGIKLDEYFEVIKENLKDIKDENFALSAMYDFFSEPEMLSALTKNPLGEGLKWGIKKLIPKALQSSLGKLDKNVNSILPALLARVNTFEGSDDEVLNYLNKVFGYKYKEARNIDLGDYVKGAISWDGESKKALVEVIPSYLRRIESVLTGDDERLFNYSTGKFDNIENIQKFYDDRVAYAETSGFNSVKSEILDVMSNLDLSSDAREQALKDVESYFRAMTKKGHLISHLDKTNEFGFTTNEIMEAGLLDYDSDRIKLLQRILNQLPKATLNEMATTAITDSRERLYKLREEDIANPNLSGYSLLHNDLDKDGKLRYDKYKSRLGNEKDRYGLGQLDYLRDIRSALINGIRVFPDHKRGKSGGVPNGRLLNKERVENEEYNRRMQEEEEARNKAANRETISSTNGKSIHEAANLNQGEWNRIFPPERNLTDNEAEFQVNRLNAKVEDALFNILYGSNNYKEIASEKLAKLYRKSKPVVETMRGMFSDTVKAFKSYFTGQGYVTSDGVQVKGKADNMLDKVKTFFTGAKTKLFDGENGEEGLLGKFTKDFMEGYNKFKVSLFGEKALSESKSKETLDSLMQKVKARLPKAVGMGVAGAMTKTFFASQLGILGNFLLPGGPLGAALMGTTLGFLKQSETFNRYMFGEKDADGNRVGGVISKEWQDKYKENKAAIKKGAGLGILASLFLPGGPVAGAIMGIGTSLYARNESFQEFLYGKDYKNDDKKSLMNGAFGKALKRLSGGESDGDPKLAAFLGAGGLGIGIAQGVGLLPSFLLPGGPVMGAMLGLAGGIAASSEKFQEFLLGEKDVDGKRYGGLLTKLTNWMNISFMQPLKIKATEMTDKVYGFMRKKLFDPIARSFEPVLYAVKNVAIDIKNGIVDAFQKVTSPVVEAFKDYVIRPIGKILKKTLIDPIKWIFKKTFGLVTKTLLGVVTLPLKGIGAIGTMAEAYNNRAVVRHEKRRRGKEYDKEHKDDGTWNRHDRKQAMKMTKEEKEELRNEKLKYRDGKTRRQRKKEQKGEYKDEMAKRKERLDNMKRQFEEDKKIAKDSKYKYGGKKQKEKREQELKEKERWIQEQQLLQAQDSDAKLEKISDNVVNISDYREQHTNRIIDKLSEIQNRIEKLIFGGDSSENENKVIPFPGTTPAPEGGETLQNKLENQNKIIPLPLPQKNESESNEDDGDKNKDDGKSSKGEVNIGGLTIVDAARETLGEIKALFQDIVDAQNQNKNNQPSLPDPDRERKRITKNEKKEEKKEAEEKEDNKEKLKNKIATVDKKTSKVISLNEKLKKDGKSHADGLDEVPEDGYIAELHEGEMVVPKKPAGMLRGMMGGLGNAIGGMANMFSSVVNAFKEGYEDDKRDRNDNALGLSDEEAEQQKELADRQRYDHASRKDVDFVQNKIANEKKEKEEKQWRDSLLSAVHSVGKFTAAGAAAGSTLFDLLEKGIDMLGNGLSNLLSGLGSLALPGAVFGGMALADAYQNTEEYKESRTDVDTDGDGEPDMIYDNYDVNKIRGVISAREPLVFKPLRTLKKKIVDPVVEGGKTLYRGAKKVGGGIKSGASKIYNSKIGQKTLQPIGNKINQGKEFLFGTKTPKATPSTPNNVIDFNEAKQAKQAGGSGKQVNKVINGADDAKVVKMPQQKLTKEATEQGSGKAVKKVVGETVDDVADNKGLFKKLIEMAKAAITAIGNKLAEKFPKLAKLGSMADEILEIVVRNSDGIIKKFANKITKFFARVTGGASTGFVLDAIFAGCDLISGATAGNAGNLFGVDPENVDLKMRIISSVLQVVTNLNALGVIGLINEILTVLCDHNFLRDVAIWIYNFISDEEDDLTNRISAKEINKCKSIDEALAIMGITDPNEIAKLKDENGEWKDFSSVKNEELGGVISPTEQMELARLQYNLANGTNLGSQAFIDKESETLGSKIVKGVGKVFKSETAQQKINKLENKAQEHKDKAAEYDKKAEESTNFISKGYNKGMSFLHKKAAERKEKKAEKKKEKAKKKKSKAEQKAAEHEEKAANSTGLAKTYHEWRAKKNKKKAEKYTLDEEKGKVVEDTSEEETSEESGGTGGSGESESKEIDPKEHIMTPEQVLANNEIPEGEIIYDAYGNAYDHNGKYLGDAGKGDGEEPTQEKQPEEKEQEKAKKTGFLGKLKGIGKLFNKNNDDPSGGGAGSGDGGGPSGGGVGSNKCPRCKKTWDKCICNNNGGGAGSDKCPRCKKPWDKCICDNNGGGGGGDNTPPPPGGGAAIEFRCSRCGNLPSQCTCKNDGYNDAQFLCSNCGQPPSKCKCNKGKGFFGKIGKGLTAMGNKAVDYQNKKMGIIKDGAVAVGKGVGKLYNIGKTNLLKNIDKGKELVGKGIEEFNEFKDNPMAYMLNSGAEMIQNTRELNKKIGAKKDEIVGKVKEKVGGTVNKVKDAVVGKVKEKTAFLTEGIEEGDSAGTKAGKVVLNLTEAINKKKDELINNVKETITGAIDKIKEMFKYVTEEIPKKIIEFKDKFKEKLTEGVERIKETFLKLKEEIPKKIEEIKENVKEKITEGIEAIKKGFNYVIKEVPKKIVEFKDKIKEKIDEGIEKIKKKFEELKEAIPKKINEIKENIVNKFKETIETVKNTFTEKINEIKEAFSKENLKKKFDEKVQEIKDAFGNFTGAIGDIFEDLKSKFKLPKLTMPDLSVTWDNIKSFFMDFAETIFKGKKEAGESGPKPSEYLTNKKFKPVQHNISSSELLKPIAGKTVNSTTTTNNATTNKTNNKFVFYNQSDARWGDNKMGGKPMKQVGCGPTSLAMAVSQMTGEQITPDTVAKLGEEHLPGYSKYSLFPSIADTLNMNYTEGKDPKFITRNLKQGIPVILSGRTEATGTPYTSEGHVVTASHMKGNMVYIQDPRGEQYSRYYPINSLMVGLNKGMIVTPSNKTDVSKLSSGDRPEEIIPNEELQNQELGLYGDVGEFESLNDDKNLGTAGAGQITMADRVLSYARAFLNNTSKFSYSQPRRLQIDTNKSSSKGCGADCSSFVSHVLSRAGDVNIYGTTSQTFWDSVGTKVSEPQIGDVVCQQGHVGLYSGDGNYIHMSGRKAGIKESKAIQKGNNPHRGYKRVLQNPSQMVDPTVPNPNSFLGTVVGTSSGQPVGGGSGGGPQASLDKALLIGDSLTVGIKSTFEGKYPNAKAMGKGGKWATQWLEDLGSLPSDDEVSTVIQWLGINGVHNNKVNLRDSQALLTKLKEKYPNKPIFNMKIFPTTEAYGYNGYKGDWWRKLSQEFNEGMSSWTGSNGVTQIDATQGFIQDDGYLKPDKAVDGIHFTSAGYKEVLANIETAIGNYNSSNTGSGGSSEPQVDQLGVFAELEKISNAMVGAIFNNKSYQEMYDAMYSTPTTGDNSGGTTPTDGSNPDISGISDTATAVWKFFTGKGYSGHATAGIMGNLRQESGLDPTIKQHGGGPGRGLAQWTVHEERFKGLEAHAKSKGKDWTDLQSQLEWIDLELNGKDAATASHLNKRFGGIEGFKKATDTKWAVEAFEKSFERAGKPNYTNRYKYAEEYYSQLSNAGTGPTMATSAETAPSDGSIPDSMNGWKFYQQSDPRWKGDVGGSSVSAGGCGPTSHAMMLSTIFGKQITPLTMTKWGRANGTWTGAMQWNMPTKVSEEFGLGVTDLGSNASGADASVLDKAKEAIKAGKPVIMTGKGKGASGSQASYDTPFTPGGHVVLAVGVDGSGNFIINDPRGAGRTKAYTPDNILNYGIGLRGAWAFDTSGGSIPSSIQTDGDYTPTGGSSGGTSTSTGGASTPQYEQMGVFADLEKVGNNLIASIYNGRKVNMYEAATSDSGGSSGGGTTPSGDGTWSGTKYDLSSYDYSDLSSEKQGHINAIIHPALETYKTHNLFPSVTIGQSAHESYWGPKSGLATKAKNLFGIKCGSKWTGKAYSAKTQEEYSPGTMTTITDKFRAYDSYADSVIDRAKFLSADRYKRVLAATTPDAQIEALKACGYATDSSYVTKLKKVVHDNKLTRFDTPNPPKVASGGSSDDNAGTGDGNTYMITPKTPKLSGNAGMGDGRVRKVTPNVSKPSGNISDNRVRKAAPKVAYTKSITNQPGINTINTEAQREIEAINRKINVAVNNANSSDPNAYKEILKLIMQELQAINSNTAETASGIHNIEIVSANEPIQHKNTGGNGLTTADTYNTAVPKSSTLRKLNTTTGYNMARQMAGYQK